MALATVLARANGLDAAPVTVEVHLAPGLPGFSIVGLPEAAVREAKDRVRAAIVTSGYPFPQRRITCNLAPADLPKDGGRFDLAIALGILAAAGEIPATALDGIEVLGELSLSGEIRPVRGLLPAALQATAANHALLIPTGGLAEAGLVPAAQLHTATQLGALCAALHAGPLPTAHPAAPVIASVPVPDMAEVRGQQPAKRAIEIAAAGAHSLLMVGPPGAGKSMLAQRLPGILPPLTADEALEVAAVASISEAGFQPEQWGQRPFRAPHHTASGVALVGGGSVPRPGEITRAHNGILFLDELPEFDRRVLEVLREPLESGTITVSRAARQADFPARFQLIAAMNPCPCGHLGDDGGRCRCTPDQVARYRDRLSGPLLDRIDLQLFVPRIERQQLLQPQATETSSADIRQRVTAARQRQLDRQGTVNARLTPQGLQQHCALDTPGRALIEQAMARLGLSARGVHRVLRVARTIADLDGETAVAPPQLAEALRYRELDRAAPG